jgi:hypothetical protein
MRTARIAVAVVFAAVAAAAQQTEGGRFRGSDGLFDVSGLLETRGGFLAAPILITEPAVGYGGGLAALFFHRTQYQPGSTQPSGRFIPPSVSAVAGFATENGSKGGLVAHFGVWRNDRVRYLGVAGAASLNLDYWGTPARPVSDPLQYEVRGMLIIQRLLFRIGDGPFLAGGEVSWSTQDAEFESLLLPPGTPPRRTEQDDGGAGFVGEYETLDNIFTPTRGVKARTIAKVFSENLGGDNERQRLDLEALAYLPLPRRLTLGLRGDFAFSSGETPFYLLPYLNMRGLPALKYAGEHTALGEIEARWNAFGRWSVVAFGGVGLASDQIAGLPDATPIGTIGAGVRYLLAERLGLHTGIDVARGPDDAAFYIIVGSAWR